MNPGKKALYTARRARTMTKWLVTYSRRRGARWNVVDFLGEHRAESRGIVDLLAVRKDHRLPSSGTKRGDLFDIILIQVKGGTASRPTPLDVLRLKQVARHHRAKAVVLAEWRRGKKPDLCRLVGHQWKPVLAAEVFG
ncbi:MAG: hypothetical protein JXQ75_06235 [Phycisphaerae bacterium]|nr:hypothetical protein [Phycisphaerae bacterium]